MAAVEFVALMSLALDDVLVATAEKALFDIAHLAGGRSRLKVGAPELELPKTFRRRRLSYWIGRIGSKRGKSIVSARLSKMLEQAV